MMPTILAMKRLRPKRQPQLSQNFENSHSEIQSTSMISIGEKKTLELLLLGQNYRKSNVYEESTVKVIVVHFCEGHWVN